MFIFGTDSRNEETLVLDKIIYMMRRVYDSEMHVMSGDLRVIMSIDTLLRAQVELKKYILADVAHCEHIYGAKILVDNDLPFGFIKVMVDSEKIQL